MAMKWNDDCQRCLHTRTEEDRKENARVGNPWGSSMQRCLCGEYVTILCCECNNDWMRYVKDREEWTDFLRAEADENACLATPPVDKDRLSGLRTVERALRAKMYPIARDWVHGRIGVEERDDG